MHLVNTEFLLELSNKTSAVLDANRTLWLPEHDILVISDLHIGKAQHFRKHGIPIPMEAALRNLELFSASIVKRKPKQLILLGDLFHSTLNNEWELLITAINRLQSIHNFDIILTVGNHDILSEEDYQQLSLRCLPWYDVGELRFVHEPSNGQILPNSITICGHLHPGVTITGKAKNRIKLPCFGLSNCCLYMPSFGNLTGAISMEWPKDARTWAILNSEFLQEIKTENRL